MSQSEDQEEPPLDEEILSLFVPWSCWIPLEGAWDGLGRCPGGAVAVRFWILLPKTHFSVQCDSCGRS